MQEYNDPSGANARFSGTTRSGIMTGAALFKIRPVWVKIRGVAVAAVKLDPQGFYRRVPLTPERMLERVTKSRTPLCSVISA